MRIGWIGAGKVGFSFGKYMVSHGVSVSGYYSRNLNTAREAARFTGSKVYEELETIVADSDALFLTVPDGAIEEVWNSLKQYALAGKCICHCSGAMSSSVFSGIDSKQAYGYSIHPLFAVSDKLQSYRELSKAFFTIEYSQESAKEKAAYFKELLQSLGNEVRMIRADQKVLYHSAAVFASNLVTGLFQTAAELLESCGFEKGEGERALYPLFLNNCENIVSQGVAASLTGPVERGDMQKIEKHLQVLSGENREIYQALSGKLIAVAEQKNSGRDYSEVKAVLENGFCKAG